SHGQKSVRSVPPRARRRVAFMNVIPTTLTGAILFELRYFADARGGFFEGWNKARYEEQGVSAPLVQSNVSVSKRGVLRGLHAQNPTPQGKLLTVMRGRIYDAIVDARPGSPTYLSWEGFE